LFIAKQKYIPLHTFNNLISQLPKIIITAVLFLLVVLPRFNSNQLLVKQQSYDSKYFKAYVEYFRGEPLTSPLRPATNWRFLVPLMASYLPFSALTSINLVNLVFLALGIGVFFKILRLLQIDETKSWYAIWIFIVSFPTFYYASIAYVDVALFPFIAMSIYANFTNRFLLFAFSVLLGFCVKETVVIALPFYFAYHYRQFSFSLVKQVTIVLILLLIERYIIQEYAPISSGEMHNKYSFWHPSAGAIKSSFLRFNTWFSLVASLGIPFVLYSQYWIQVIKGKTPLNQMQIACAASILLTLGLYLFSFISTIADGRIIWMGYFYFLIGWLHHNKMKNEATV
jgi:hypothetical protein